MLSSMIVKAAVLKPEIRLAQSISEFEASLSDGPKATFRSYRSQSLGKPPGPSDVMRLTAEIDRRSLQQNGGSQCFGPRLTNILQAVQQYAALGDIIIGGSQNIIACGIWSLFRLTLLALVSSSSYMEKLSRLLMEAGRKAPRYEQMAFLYPRSSNLQSSLSEYFIVVVQLCRQLYKETQKTTFGSYFSFLNDHDLKEHEASLQRWADCIKDEVTVLNARKIAEQSTFLGVLSKNSDYQSHREQLRTRFRVLEACSTYDHQTTWKEIRKCGNSTILSQLDHYPAWKAGTSSSTLLCTGKLGFGKSVLLANMVDELNLSTESKDTAVIYFFCRHDIQESLRARTIIGSIARQLINANLSRVPHEIINTNSISNLDNLLEFVSSIISEDTEALLVLDGLDECDDHDRDTTLSHLKRLQEAFTLKICCSFRSDVHLNKALKSADTLLHCRVAQLPEENPDISTFVSAELERCIETGRLCVSDPTLVSEIQHALIDRAQGMFLWTILQIASLCTALSDEEIREALEDLPKGLPETFSRILKKCRGTGEKYQKLIFQLCMVARHPLTTEELREALSVVPFNTEWTPARLINNIFSVLPFCGSLITIDEEDLTVRFLHHSVKQYLLGESDLAGKPILTLEDANQAMGEIVITYLNYDTFETALSTTVFTQMMAQDMPSNIVKSAFRDLTPSRKAAVSMLKRGRPYQLDLRDTLIRAKSAIGQISQFEFRTYAQANWIWHVQWVFLHQDARALALLMTMLKQGRVNIHDKDGNGETIMFRAVESASPGVVKNLLDYGFGTHDSNMNGSTTLHAAAARGETSIISYLLDHGANLEVQDDDGMTPLLVATSGGHQAAMEQLIKAGANLEVQGDDGMTALSLAACQGNHGAVKFLLEMGANSSHEDKDQCIPLSLAASKGHREAVIILIEYASYVDLRARDRDGATAASNAACQGHLDILSSLLDKGADIETRDNNCRTPLLLSVVAGRISVVELLLGRGASVAAADNNGWTALHWAAYKGHNDITRSLLDTTANVEDIATDGWTPILLALDQGHKTIVQLLVARGASVTAKNQHVSSALRIAVRQGNDAIIYLLLGYSKTYVELKTSEEFVSSSTQFMNQNEAGTQQNTEHNSPGSDAHTTSIIAPPAQNQCKEKASNVSEIHLKSDSSCRVVRRPDLCWAVDNGHDMLVECLIDFGADTEVKDANGLTPLLRATDHGQSSIVKLLVDGGADVNAKTVDGRTALHMSAQKGNRFMMRLLLRNGSADVHARTQDNRTVLHILAENGQRDMIQLLLEKSSADVHAKIYDDRTVLHILAEKGHGDLVQLRHRDGSADVHAILSANFDSFGGKKKRLSTICEEQEEKEEEKAEEKAEKSEEAEEAEDDIFLPSKVHITLPKKTPHILSKSVTVTDLTDWIDNSERGLDVSLPNWESTKQFLRGRDILLLIDNSKFMQEEKREVLKIVNALSYIFKKLDTNGIEVACTSSPGNMKRLHTATDIERFIRGEFHNGSDANCGIEAALDFLLAGVRNKHLKQFKLSKFSRIWTFSPSSSTSQGILIFVLSNGQWDRSEIGTSGVGASIMRLFNEMDTLGVPRTHICFQFLRFGNSERGRRRLEFLDEYLSRSSQNGMYDIVDCKPIAASIWDILIGSLSSGTEETEDP